MRDLYDKLIVEGETGIQRLIGDRTQEGLQLDFKQKAQPSHGAFEDNDKKILAKAVSGFANSAGGLIVWGVNAKKIEGVDCAQPPAAPITQIERFASEAATLVGQLIQPRHDGVYITPIPSAAGDGSGFLLMYVERSERRPHRSEAKGQKQYFRRAGDSFFEMEHYDIEDAFKRISLPKISVGYRFSLRAFDGLSRPLIASLDIYLENTSVITANKPYIQLSDVFSNGSRMDESPKITQSVEGTWLTYSGDASVVVHPGVTRTLIKYIIDFKHDPIILIDNIKPNMWGFSANCRFGCENVPAVEQRLEIDATGIYTLYRSN